MDTEYPLAGLPIVLVIGFNDMFPVTAAVFTAEGTTNILVNRYIPLWGSPRTILSVSTTCSSVTSFHKLYTSCWVCASLPQAPISLNATGALSG